MMQTVMNYSCEDSDLVLMTIEEFINKMRSFNEIEVGKRYPEDPNNFYYKIDINNKFRCVHITTAYELIEQYLDLYIHENWNDNRPLNEEIIVAMTDELLRTCLFEHKLKKLVYQAIIKSVHEHETEDIPPPPPPPPPISENLAQNDEHVDN